jgi:hypothetical protein
MQLKYLYLMAQYIYFLLIKINWMFESCRGVEEFQDAEFWWEKLLSSGHLVDREVDIKGKVPVLN